MNELYIQLGLTYKWIHLFMSFIKIPKQQFEIQVTPVTQYQWQSIMESNPSKFKNIVNSEVCPVEMVSYEDCLQFIDKINKQDKLYIYRLPTEHEWEYSCTTEMDNSAKEFSVSETNSTEAVGSKLPNKYGLYDMLGNVWEWTSTSEGSLRVLRGGSWSDDARYLRSAFRYYSGPESRFDFVGFRLVRTLKK